ncbi:MAG: helix-turn-helix domain-containing protein [Acidobacteriia bacterium]|nr:helix-turn-helix domain-containing protein [Terriglobia bacterium]
MKTPQLLTTKQAAEILAVPEGTLRYWRKSDVGPRWIKLEGTVRYDLADVLQYIERGRRTPSVRAHMEENDVSL